LGCPAWSTRSPTCRWPCSISGSPVDHRAREHGKNLADRRPAEGFAGTSDQGAKNHGRGARVIQGGVGRGDVEPKLLDQARESRSLALGELQHKTRESRGVDDRMQQRALQAAAHQPGIERIVAVFDQDGALGEAEERAASVAKFGSADQHRPVDVVPLLGVWVDRRAAIDERVEKGKRP
jgi:hypothetical protein